MRFKGRRLGLIACCWCRCSADAGHGGVFLLLTVLGDIIPVLGIGSAVARSWSTWVARSGEHTSCTGSSTRSHLSRRGGSRRRAGHARIFFTIVLRLVAPILAVVALL
jgi:arabinogalactan oligomer/maltooligosaccharide transport system permease protein